MYFSYSPCIGFSIHKNEDEARGRAESELEYARAEAIRCEGWFHGIGAICYGKVTHRATEVLESSEDYVALFDTSDDYQMKSVDDGE